MSGHTPGPWSSPFGLSEMVYPEYTGALRICIVNDEHPDFHANARLIRAAPALLAALEALSEDMDRAGGDRDGMPECPWCKAGPDGADHLTDCELIEARAAISKARGDGA